MTLLSQPRHLLQLLLLPPRLPLCRLRMDQIPPVRMGSVTIRAEGIGFGATLTRNTSAIGKPACTAAVVVPVGLVQVDVPEAVIVVATGISVGDARTLPSILRTSIPAIRNIMRLKVTG